MLDILHRVGVKAPSKNVYNALATQAGLAGWWTTDTRWDGRSGSVIHFQFGDAGFIDVKVLELDPGRGVLWEVVDGPEEWLGHKIIWTLREEDGYTLVHFKQRGWREASEFMHHCSTKWAVFLLSLKALLETGSGRPYPDDTKIDNWN